MKTEYLQSYINDTFIEPDYAEASEGLKEVIKRWKDNRAEYKALIQKQNRLTSDFAKLSPEEQNRINDKEVYDIKKKNRAEVSIWQERYKNRKASTDDPEEITELNELISDTITELSRYDNEIKAIEKKHGKDALNNQDDYSLSDEESRKIADYRLKSVALKGALIAAGVIGAVKGISKSKFMDMNIDELKSHLNKTKSAVNESYLLDGVFTELEYTEATEGLKEVIQSFKDANKKYKTVSQKEKRIKASDAKLTDKEREKRDVAKSYQDSKWSKEYYEDEKAKYKDYIKNPEEDETDDDIEEYKHRLAFATSELNIAINNIKNLEAKYGKDILNEPITCEELTPDEKVYLRDIRSFTRTLVEMGAIVGVGVAAFKLDAKRKNSIGNVKKSLEKAKSAVTESYLLDGVFTELEYTEATEGLKEVVNKWKANKTKYKELVAKQNRIDKYEMGLSDTDRELRQAKKDYQRSTNDKDYYKYEHEKNRNWLKNPKDDETEDDLENYRNMVNWTKSELDITMSRIKELEKKYGKNTLLEADNSEVMEDHEVRFIRDTVSRVSMFYNILGLIGLVGVATAIDAKRNGKSIKSKTLGDLSDSIQAAKSAVTESYLYDDGEAEYEAVLEFMGGGDHVTDAAIYHQLLQQSAVNANQMHKNMSRTSAKTLSGEDLIDKIKKWNIIRKKNKSISKFNKEYWKSDAFKAVNTQADLMQAIKNDTKWLEDVIDADINGNEDLNEVKEAKRMIASIKDGIAKYKDELKKIEAKYGKDLRDETKKLSDDEISILNNGRMAVAAAVGIVGSVVGIKKIRSTFANKGIGQSARQKIDDEVSEMRNRPRRTGLDILTESYLINEGEEYKMDKFNEQVVIAMEAVLEEIQDDILWGGSLESEIESQIEEQLGEEGAKVVSGNRIKMAYDKWKAARKRKGRSDRKELVEEYKAGVDIDKARLAASQKNEEYMKNYGTHQDYQIAKAESRALIDEIEAFEDTIKQFETQINNADAEGIGDLTEEDRRTIKNGWRTITAILAAVAAMGVGIANRKKLVEWAKSAKGKGEPVNKEGLKKMKERMAALKDIISGKFKKGDKATEGYQGGILAALEAMGNTDDGMDETIEGDAVYESEVFLMALRGECESDQEWASILESHGTEMALYDLLSNPEIATEASKKIVITDFKTANFNRIVNRTAIRLAMKNGDQLYDKYQKYRDLLLTTRDAIYRKYNTKAKTAARAIIANARKKSANMPSNGGSQITDKMDKVIARADKNLKNGKPITSK